MSLTPEQFQALGDSLSEHATPDAVKCPLSGDSNWSIFSGGLVFLRVVDNPATGDPADSVVPLALVTCNTCGYTWLVNVVQLGLRSELGLDQDFDG